MTAASPIAPPRPPALGGQTLLVIGGSAGIGLETARRARAEGADVVLTGRNPDRLKDAAAALGARSTASFDAEDTAALEAFFAGLEGTIDHVMVTAGGPYYAPLAVAEERQEAVALGVGMRVGGRLGDRLTGAYALGPEAGEWLQQATLAIRAHVPLDVLADTIQPFPTFSEIYVEALKVLRKEIAASQKPARSGPMAN